MFQIRFPWSDSIDFNLSVFIMVSAQYGRLDRLIICISRRFRKKAKKKNAVKNKQTKQTKRTKKRERGIKRKKKDERLSRNVENAEGGISQRFTFSCNKRFRPLTTVIKRFFFFLEECIICMSRNAALSDFAKIKTHQPSRLNIVL